MRLVDVLDPIIGIEYPCLNKNNKSDILRNIEFPNENVISSISSVSGIENILLNKIVYAYKNRDNIIELKEDDFPKKEFSYKDLPDTMYVVFNIINNKHTINLKGFYGTSAANIISRFYFIDKRIEHIINRIVNIETDLNKDKILAEILHIPNLVVANVTVRPNIRNFKISYINNHIDGIESIDLMDIDIFLDYDGNLSLWSNKLKKTNNSNVDKRS
ncbi:lantibiotic dehydratase family protein (plasmid) [Parabacteroides distasonis]|nr:lantibiotic dehydratase family protein [Parabacteroides distasonis]